jgi:beta-1,4-mannosyl-glycoprotein beta-1,4-N-acetylglucosaminyltransferase
MQIIDCFTFFNELKILELRLTELNDVVDHFILVESSKTFSNNEKPLFYKDNKHLFEKFNDKIIHIIVDDLPEGDAWNREAFQRNAIQRGLNQLQLDETDIIIISDCDEIPNPALLEQIIENGMNEDIYALCQDLYYYNLECKKPDPIDAAKIVKYQKLKELGGPNNVRIYSPEYIHIFLNAGWHFSYFGGVDNIKYKIQSYSHQEFNTKEYLENLADKISEREDIFSRVDEDIEYIPIAENQNLPKNYKIIM